MVKFTLATFGALDIKKNINNCLNLKVDDSLPMA